MAYDMTKWVVTELEADYLSRLGTPLTKGIQWCALIKPDAPVDKVVRQLTAAVKAISNMSITPGHSSVAWAIDNNRPMIAEK